VDDHSREDTATDLTLPHAQPSADLASGDRVDRAFRASPRTAFLPRDQVPHAEWDQPLPIGFGQTSSQPSTVARMLRLLDVPVGGHVLDVGSGSGWTTALLAHLTGPEGSVVGVELEPELATWGAENLAATGRPWARIVVARPGVLGVPEEAPYDRILVSAEAPELPTALVEQLGPLGCMVAPVAGGLAVVRRTDEGLHLTRHEGYRFVPLR
jgi:protein-L-isoaspartate(D-aspartate) O-methyltransferase